VPDAWQGYRFKLRYRGSLLEVAAGQGRVAYRLLEGPGVRLNSGGREVELDPENRTVVVQPA
jgi:trehalose/maltose hydrolase-like predicted phosphorylase